PDAGVDNSPPRRHVWDPAATDLVRVQRCVTLMLYITPVITSRSSTTHRSAEPTVAGTAAAPPVVESTHRQPSAGRCIRHAACERAWTPALCCCCVHEPTSRPRRGSSRLSSRPGEACGRVLPRARRAGSALCHPAHGCWSRPQG